METTENEATPDIAARVTEILDAFVAKGAPGATVPVRVLFDLTGEGGGNFLLNLAQDAVSWKPTLPDGDAEVTVRLAALDFVAIADGEFDGRLAVASERIEIVGDRALAEKMLELVDPDTI